MFNRIPQLRRINTEIETDDDRFYSWMVHHNFFKEDERKMLKKLWIRSYAFIILATFMYAWYCIFSDYSLLSKFITANLIIVSGIFSLRSSFTYACIISRRITGMGGFFIKNPTLWFPRDPDAPYTDNGIKLLTYEKKENLFDFTSNIKTKESWIDR